MNTEEKAKAYDEALRRAKEINNEQRAQPFDVMTKVFPELKKSDDEWIRKEIIETFKILGDGKIPVNINYADIFTWLEKQGEQPKEATYTHEVETGNGNIKALVTEKVQLPKFHEGEWLCEKEPNNYARFIQILGIVNIKGKERYRISRDIHNDEDIVKFDFVEKYYHKFDIKDAKDGDVLASNRSIFIFSQEYIAGKPEAHCGIMNGLFLAKPEGCWTNEECYPATKEQRDLLFQKMKEAGYEWDAETKELKSLISNGGDFDEKNCEQKHSIDINKMADDYANSSERGNEEFGKPVPCMIRAYRQGLNDAIGKVVRNPAWSEEDETGWTNTMIMIKEVASNHYTKDSIKLVIDWLKSLKQRIGWKPSAGQMKALHDLNLTGNISYAGQGQVLIELYNDLKKLIE